MDRMYAAMVDLYPILHTIRASSSGSNIPVVGYELYLNLSAYLDTNHVRTRSQVPVPLLGGLVFEHAGLSFPFCFRGDSPVIVVSSQLSGLSIMFLNIFWTNYR
jgi:hypothetical protein